MLGAAAIERTTETPGPAMLGAAAAAAVVWDSCWPKGAAASSPPPPCGDDEAPKHAASDAEGSRYASCQGGGETK